MSLRVARFRLPLRLILRVYRILGLGLYGCEEGLGVLGV